MMCYVALGSNLGQPAQQLVWAMDQLERHSAAPLRRSSLWKSVPVDCPPGSPPFLNAVVAMVPNAHVEPLELLALLQSLEQGAGRPRVHGRNEARLLDLDLIAWGGMTLFLPTLVLPHPRAHLRRFVLEPLAQLEPNLVLPGQALSVTQLLAPFRAAGSKEVTLLEAA